jgi:hypothetical protein
MGSSRRVTPPQRRRMQPALLPHLVNVYAQPVNSANVREPAKFGLAESE